MSKVGLSIKLDVTKIEKARLFRGNKGTYLDATVFVDLDELDQYGNSGMITQDVTKEEKDSGVKGPILGNVKVFWKEVSGQSSQGRANSGQSSQAPAKNHKPSQQSSMDDFDSDLPF